MSATTLRQVEGAPTSWPAVPANLSPAAAALPVAMLWSRIEPYIAHRFTPRNVVWLLEGPGDWSPPLTPATVSAVEVWEATAWVATTPPASPFGGYDFPGEGPYRVTASVGGGTVPPAVSEAFRRLAEYSAEVGADGIMSGHPSHTAHAVDLGGISETFDRPANWAARAMANSGAADLLRPYRRTC